MEARNRVGGRIWTDRSTGKALDLGASWIHAITGLVDYNDTSTFDADGKEDPLTPNQEKNFDDVLAQFSKIVTASNANASVQDVVDEAVRQGPLNNLGTRALN